MKRWKVIQEKLMKNRTRLMRDSKNYAKKTEDMMDRFLQITSSVGTQIQGVNSSVVKLKEEDDRYKQFNERITNIEKILDMDEKYENRSEVIEGEHVDQNQGKAVVTGLHSETTESEVTQLLKESINEVGMDIGSARVWVHRETDHTRVHPLQK